MDLEELQKIESRFLFFIPKGLELYDLSYRNEAEKWSTLRFYTNYRGERLRVKEFFLDWFYTSFPKNLMKSFVDSYSNLSVYKEEGFKVFIGMDYKDILASSAFMLGTQVEIEGVNTETILEVNRLMHPLQNDDRFKEMPYHERSFFSRNKSYNWFEEERIARMSWHKPHYPYSINGSIASSFGIFSREGQTQGITLIFNKDYFTKVIWLEISRLNEAVPHNYYILRREGNLYKFTEFKGGIIGYIDESGPGIWQRLSGNYVVTVSFSSDTSVGEFILEFDNIEGIISEIITKYF